jgi:hypothetical protein
MYLEFVFATWPIFCYTRRQFITLYTVLSYVCTYIGINFLQNIFFTEASGQPATTPLQWHQVFHSKYKLSYLVVCVTTYINVIFIQGKVYFHSTLGVLLPIITFTRILQRVGKMVNRVCRNKSCSYSSYILNLPT